MAIKNELVSLLCCEFATVKRRAATSDKARKRDMVQRKKPEARAAILAGAFALFSRQGYSATTLTEIARSANMSTGNVYIYFQSKLAILYAIYDPWLRARMDALEQELAAIKAPQQRMRRLLIALWRDIPAEENAFVNNIMQAISAADPSDGYRSTLVRWFEKRIAGIIDDALPVQKRQRLRKARIAQVLIMAFDGYAIQRHLRPKGTGVDNNTINALAAMLVGDI